MSIKISNLIQDEVRANIPFVIEGKTEYIVIKNASKEVREDLGNLIWRGIEDVSKKVDGNELLSFAIDKLTNIEINEDLDTILNGNISYELNMVFFNVTQILTEITNEVLMNANIQLEKTLTKELKDGISQKTEEIARVKNINLEKVK